MHLLRYFCASMKLYDLVLLTEERYLDTDTPDWYTQQILDDDALLIQALANHGKRVIRKDWADPNFDWSSTTAIMFRTTWNYFHRFAEFVAWMNRVEGLTQLINAPELIRWNWDKHYLHYLEKNGVRIPETIFLEQGEYVTLAELHNATGWDETVLKPAISGGGRHTYRLDTTNVDAHEVVFRSLVHAEAMLLQPFQYNIVTRGEVSLMVIGGKYTHAVIKTAKVGDYRVQDDFGGTAAPYLASPEEIALAEHVVTLCHPAPVYARVDIIWDNDNLPAVSELELIEPELWLRNCPEAAVALAEAVCQQLGR
jgi:glutathione synthase/RimK-type ligase-like ATP-grasp enzyme